MNKFVLDTKAILMLQEWRVTHADLNKQIVKSGKWYFDKFEILYSRGENDEFHVYIEKHHRYVEVKLCDIEGAISVNKLYPSEKMPLYAKPNDDTVIKTSPNKRRFANATEEEIKVALVISQDMAVHAMALNTLLLAGNIVEPSDRKISAMAAKDSNGDRIYTIKPYKDSLYAVGLGTHRTPEGVFSVRGHIRRYKDGKTVWIDSYLKGVDKE